MADMKFSCPQCGQHIGYNEAWVGHQIECPACHNSIIVPQIQRQPAPSAAAVPVKEATKLAGPKLAQGVTQVARSTAHAPAPVKKFVPKRPRGDNSLLKYSVMFVVIVVLAGVGYFYGLPLITGAVQTGPAGNSSAGAKAPQTGGGVGGPMGDVSGAMDVSETLDGGSSAARRRPVAATNNAAGPRSAKPPR